MNQGLSVVIPVLNEAKYLASTLRAIKKYAPDSEIIVVDGGSRDGSADVARALGAKVLATHTSSRGYQLNLGARAASRCNILFLHADTLVPTTFQADIEATISGNGVILGAFRFKIASNRPIFRVIERMVHLRCRLFSMPYGDQGLFLRRDDFFKKLSCFREIPIMEDFDLVRRARAKGRIAIAGSSILTSPRRWEQHGIVKTTFINQVMIMGYLLGIHSERLARIYYSI